MQRRKLADSSLPSAHITTNKNRIKVYPNNTIYFNDGQSFEIELENPTPYTVKAKIWVNGRVIADNGIVIRSHDKVYLERFIDDPNKFKFNTFEVDDVIDTYHQRNRNGLVQIEFYKESSTNITNTNLYTWSPISISTPYDNTFFTTNHTDTTRGLINDSVTMYTQTVNKVETGRIDKGSHSNQSFSSYYGTFDAHPLNAVTYHIKPVSTMEESPIDLNDIRQYCPECGYRIRKSSWKFCPKCGENLSQI